MIFIPTATFFAGIPEETVNKDLTVIQEQTDPTDTAETSPEARKVKRAKARAAYTAAARTETVQIRQLDVKAE